MIWLRRSALAAIALALLAVSPQGAPVRFVPFVLPTGTNIMDPSLTQDQQTLYATRVVGTSGYAIVMSTRSAGTWSSPRVVPFSGRWRDLEEVLSPDGTSMVFSSNRPVRSGGNALDAHYYHRFGRARGGNLWIVRRSASGWGEPEHLPAAINADTSVFSPTIAADGTLVFMRPSGPRAAFHLFTARLDNGMYRTSTLAPFSDERYDDFDPTIAPDGSFVIFTSTRPPMPKKKSALFISYNKNGTWTTPRLLGGAIPNNVIEARLSPDLKTLYFTSKSNLWKTGLST